ncbi:hypothetical protein J6590_004584 [Homalodisca vitripennis]|nr:hypothetical protein J6590_004584 [Homalodisca vitripennis]
MMKLQTTRKISVICSPSSFPQSTGPRHQIRPPDGVLSSRSFSSGADGGIVIRELICWPTSAALMKLICSVVDAPSLLEFLALRASRHLRQSQLFARWHYSTQYIFHSAYPRLQRLANCPIIWTSSVWVVIP